VRIIKNTAMVKNNFFIFYPTFVITSLLYNVGMRI
jgi:hypothetical protein